MSDIRSKDMIRSVVVLFWKDSDSVKRRETSVVYLRAKDIVVSAWLAFVGVVQIGSCHLENSMQ